MRYYIFGEFNRLMIIIINLQTQKRVLFCV